MSICGRMRVSLTPNQFMPMLLLRLLPLPMTAVVPLLLSISVLLQQRARCGWCWPAGNEKLFRGAGVSSDCEFV